VFGTAAKKYSGAGTCLRTPICMIKLLGSVICIILMETGRQLWYDMTECHRIQKHVTTQTSGGLICCFSVVPQLTSHP